MDTNNMGKYYKNILASFKIAFKVPIGISFEWIGTITFKLFLKFLKRA